MSAEFENRIALVTGAGQGMGLGVARRLSQLGAQVLLNDIDAEKAEAAAQDIVASGDDVASAVEYLVSDGASWVTGQTLVVNGGSYTI